MKPLKHYKIDISNKDLAEEITKKFKIKYSDEISWRELVFNNESSFVPKTENELFYLVGNGLEDILGYAQVEKLNKVPFEYKNKISYTRKGDFLHLDFIEILEKRKSLGYDLLEKIKEDNYEIIEVVSKGEIPIHLYTSQFKDSGETRGESGRVLVWKNPKYSGK